jgi:hypothetical protein
VPSQQLEEAVRIVADAQAGGAAAVEEAGG